MWYKAESIDKPESIDTTSSKNWVYVRQNIKQESREDEDGKTMMVWVYDEKKVSKDNWDLYKKVERLRADLDYVCMMDDIELEEYEEVEDE